MSVDLAGAAMVASLRREMKDLKAHVESRADRSEKTHEMAVARAEGQVAALRVSIAQRDATIETLRKDLVQARQELTDEKKATQDLVRAIKHVETELLSMKVGGTVLEPPQRQVKKPSWWESLPCANGASDDDPWWLPPKRQTKDPELTGDLECASPTSTVSYGLSPDIKDVSGNLWYGGDRLTV